MVAKLVHGPAERARSGCRSFSGLIKFADNPKFAFHGNCETEKTVATRDGSRSQLSSAPHSRSGSIAMSRRVRRKLRHKPRPNTKNRFRSPGTLLAHPDAEPSQIRAIAFGNGNFEELPINDLKKITELRGRFPLIWVNVDGLANVEAIQELGRQFDLHPLALEDVLNQHQVSKSEDYPSHLFFVSRMINWNGEIQSEQLSLFLGSNFVVTIQQFPGDCFDTVRDRIRKTRGKLATCSADYLAYSLLDAIVDSYFPVVDRLADELDTLEEQVDSSRSPRLISELHRVRNCILVGRRSVRPLRDAINQLIRDPSPFIREETKFFLRDCHDHCIQIIELLETYRELCSDLRDYYVSMISFRMNEIMKVLTVISTIFIPLSFIASVYGMNFDTNSPWNMPELGWRFGYFFALGLMALTALGFVFYFWRNGWLSGNELPSVSARSSNDAEPKQ
jgi:magnesium transporter